MVVRLWSVAMVVGAIAAACGGTPSAPSASTPPVAGLAPSPRIAINASADFLYVGDAADVLVYDVDTKEPVQARWQNAAPAASF